MFFPASVSAAGSRFDQAAEAARERDAIEAERQALEEEAAEFNSPDRELVSAASERWFMTPRPRLTPRKKSAALGCLRTPFPCSHCTDCGD